MPKKTILAITICLLGLAGWGTIRAENVSSEYPGLCGLCADESRCVCAELQSYPPRVVCSCVEGGNVSPGETPSDIGGGSGEWRVPPMGRVIPPTTDLPDEGSATGEPGAVEGSQPVTPFYMPLSPITHQAYDVHVEAEINVVTPEGQAISQDILLGRTASGSNVLETPAALAESSEEFVVEDSELFVETSVGRQQISIMPEKAIEVSATSQEDSIEKVELRVENQKPIYRITGSKTARLLFLIPVSMNVVTGVDAQTGDVISVEKPWWSFLAWE